MERFCLHPSAGSVAVSSGSVSAKAISLSDLTGSDTRLHQSCSEKISTPEGHAGFVDTQVDYEQSTRCDISCIVFSTVCKTVRICVRDVC